MDYFFKDSTSMMLNLFFSFFKDFYQIYFFIFYFSIFLKLSTTMLNLFFFL